MRHEVKRENARVCLAFASAFLLFSPFFFLLSFVCVLMAGSDSWWKLHVTFRRDANFPWTEKASYFMMLHTVMSKKGKAQSQACCCCLFCVVDGSVVDGVVACTSTLGLYCSMSWLGFLQRVRSTYSSVYSFPSTSPRHSTSTCTIIGFGCWLSGGMVEEAGGGRRRSKERRGWKRGKRGRQGEESGGVERGEGREEEEKGGVERGEGREEEEEEREKCARTHTRTHLIWCLKAKLVCQKLFHVHDGCSRRRANKRAVKLLQCCQRDGRRSKVSDGESKRQSRQRIRLCGCVCVSVSVSVCLYLCVCVCTHFLFLARVAVL